MNRLPHDFYARDSRVVARALLGKVVYVADGAGESRGARIVETEAYHGPRDAASHAFGGPTPRSAIMFGPAGRAYIYLIYGMYHCLNVVCGDEGFPAAVLIRAGALADGAARAGAGPGKLCRALGIDRRLNGEDLVAGERIFVADDRFPRSPIRRGPRLNIDYAGAWAHRPWRFWLDGHPAVSR